MRFLRRNALTADAVVGAIAATLGILIAATSEFTRGPLWLNVVVMLGYGIALASRHRTPVPAAGGFLAVLYVLAAGLLPPPRFIGIFFGLLLFSYSAGASRRSLLSRGFLPLLVGGIVAADLAITDPTVSDFVFPAALGFAAYGAGRNAAFRSALAAELHEATLRAEESQIVEERRAVAGERRRIAREMHDVVAHSISVMVVQAGGARRIIERDPQRAAAAATAIEHTGRETLLEMRRLLGVMRGDAAPAELEPSPTLADLGALCARRGARLERLGHARPLPSGLEMGVYRVVQDALDDVERAVPGAAASVTLEWLPDALAIAIDDDRPYAGPELVSVRERVALYDGELRTGQRPEGGGHQLDVRFPLPDPEPDQIEAVPASQQGAP